MRYWPACGIGRAALRNPGNFYLKFPFSLAVRQNRVSVAAISAEKFEGGDMTRPEPVGVTQRSVEAGVTEKDDFDEASDLCDFGYELAVDPEAGPVPAAERRRNGSA